MPQFNLPLSANTEFQSWLPNKLSSCSWYSSCCVSLSTMCRKCLIKESFILKCSFLGAEFSDSECVVFDKIFHKTKVEFKRGASVSLMASAVSLMEKLLSPSSCKAQGDSGSLVILKDLHLVPFFTKMRFNNNRKKNRISAIRESYLSTSSLCISWAADNTFWMYRGLAAGISRREAGLSVRIALEVYLCHLLLLAKYLLISFRLFLVQGAVASKWKVLTDTVVATRVGRNQTMHRICA